MTVSENRLFALTYISSYVDGDEFSVEAIEDQMTKEELIEELAQVSTILAITLGVFMDKENPASVSTVMETLRRIITTDS